MMMGVLFIAMAGCATAQRSRPVTASLPPHDLIDLSAPAETPERAAGYFPALEGERGTRRTILALSGGGQYGAYTAGVLKGWTASGKRPTFDVVTGISTGSLIAPFAFLGSDYDDFLECHYTSIRSRDIFRLRKWYQLPWSDSIAEAAPLRDLIAREVTEEFLDRIARAHANGRRLYVGTTNLDSKRLVVWDMGAIASGKRPGRTELFRNILLASCSVPGILPPVAIDVFVNGKSSSELHVDGGVTASIFVDPAMFRENKAARENAPRAGVDVYAIVSGTTQTDPAKIQHGLVPITVLSLSTMYQARKKGDLTQLFLATNLAGGKFHLADVPHELCVDTKPFDFDPTVMQTLFDAGYDSFATSATPWREAPPGTNSDERHPPRSGVRFATSPQARSIEQAKEGDSGTKPRGFSSVLDRIFP